MSDFETMIDARRHFDAGRDGFVSQLLDSPRRGRQALERLIGAAIGLAILGYALSRKPEE